VIAFAVVVLGLGLAALFGTPGGSGHVATATSTTNIVSNVIVPGSGQTHHVVVPNVVGESQSQATATLAAAGLGTSAKSVDSNDGSPVGAVVAESPWQSSIVMPGSLVLITVAD
jgi:beta-lactam-binding protein with PASTA domain